MLNEFLNMSMLLEICSSFKINLQVTKTFLLIFVATCGQKAASGDVIHRKSLKGLVADKKAA